ncbi:hypothetical protein MASR2M15_23410 [Anaerolineales bacterium]
MKILIKFTLLISLFTLMIPSIFAQDSEPMLTNLNQSVDAMVAAPFGPYIYIASGDQIHLYQSSPDGSLSLLSSVEVPTSPGIGQILDMSISGDGYSLFVIREGFIGRSLLAPIYAFDRNLSSGALSLREGELSVPLRGGRGLTAIASRADGGMLFLTADAQDMIIALPITQTVTLAIAPYKKGCIGMAPQLCLQSQSAQSSEWQNFYGQIEGFTYEWAYRYLLKVEISQNLNPPADGSSTHYKLIEVLEQSPATDEAFELTVFASLLSVKDSSLAFYDGQIFTCATPEAKCMELMELMETDKPIKMQMHFDTEQNLILDSWQIAE